MNNQYKDQDRGDKNSYKQYLEAMDAIAIEKVASASTFFSSKAENTVVDVGMASGTSTAILADLFPDQNIIGVDINPTMVEMAQNVYTGKNLSFRVDDGETLATFKENSIDGFFNCSAIHHITSYNDYDINRAYNTLLRQYNLLKDGGIIVVRDFVKPEIEEVFLELSIHKKKDRPSDCDLLIIFSKTARSLSKKGEQGFPIEEVISSNKETRRFKLCSTDAVEFIRRKDYFKNWDIELQEEYGYFTQYEFEECFNRLGLRIILSAPIYNQWIINNRYTNQFKLYNAKGIEMGSPPTNYIIVGEKNNSSKNLSLTRHLPLTNTPFLIHSAFENKVDKTIYEVVSRPNEVKDIIPYLIQDGKLKILAKKGYPRPIINAFKKDSLDNKSFSGYITEGISISKNLDIEDALIKIFNIDTNINKSQTELLLNYYTSPGGIDEYVSSYAVLLESFPNETIRIPSNRSDFSDSGTIQIFDATELLNTAQTGALVEARLELNIYQLFQQKSLSLPNWLGEKIVPQSIPIVQLQPITWDELSNKKANDYVEASIQNKFLTTSRACFSEIGAKNNHSNILEFTHPKNLSINTLVTVPIYSSNGEIYIGIEERSLPVPQQHTDNSILFTVPAKRLSKKVQNLSDLHSYISDYEIGNSKIINYYKLGEKYFPSIGITPEQVYPFVVTLDSPDRSLHWLKLQELYFQQKNLNDAHLLICINRLAHVLKI